MKQHLVIAVFAIMAMSGLYSMNPLVPPRAPEFDQDEISPELLAEIYAEDRGGRASDSQTAK